MTAEAKAICEASLEHGPLDTVRLRREARMSAESAKSRFDRALVELQVGLKVLPIGVAEAGAWRYAFVYEIVQRYLPDLPEQARPIGRGEARRQVQVAGRWPSTRARPATTLLPLLSGLSLAPSCNSTCPTEERRRGWPRLRTCNLAGAE
jgi:hypothetical protein